MTLKLKFDDGGRLHSLVGRATYWLLDYGYVGYWQIHGFLFRASAAEYLQNVDPDRCPVLLVPGVYERWQFLRPIADALHARGHPVHVVTALGYNRGSIAKMSRLVEAYLDEEDLRDTAIVAHSKGGLIGKQVMSGDSGYRVRRMAAINTPFSGSIYARFFLVPSIRAFSPSNTALRTLAGNIAANSRITSIYSKWDPHIPGGSRLEGACNIRIPAYGHFRVLADQRLLEAVRRTVEE